MDIQSTKKVWTDWSLSSKDDKGYKDDKGTGASKRQKELGLFNQEEGSLRRILLRCKNTSQEEVKTEPDSFQW